MDNGAVKGFAVFARKALIESVRQRAHELGVTESGFSEPQCSLSEQEKDQLRQLHAVVEERGFQRIIEESAYIWFNHFAAIFISSVNIDFRLLLFSKIYEKGQTAVCPYTCYDIRKTTLWCSSAKE